MVMSAFAAYSELISYDIATVTMKVLHDIL